MCPTCHTSARPVRLAGGARIKLFHPAPIDAGDPRRQIKGSSSRTSARGSSPPRRARVRPARLVAADRRRAGRRRGARRALALEREPEPEPAPQRWSLTGTRSSRRRAPARRGAGPVRWVNGLAASFAAGLVSIAFPCVLPLVPGYLSAITASRSTGSASVASPAAWWPRASRSRSASLSSSSCSAPPPPRSAAGSTSRRGRRSPASCSSCSGSPSWGCCRCRSACSRRAR